MPLLLSIPGGHARETCRVSHPMVSEANQPLVRALGDAEEVSRESGRVESTC